MPAFRIVEALDVIEYISPRLVSGAVRFAPYALGLQRREEALQRCIVPDVARTAHRTDDAVIPAAGMVRFSVLVNACSVPSSSQLGMGHDASLSATGFFE